MPADRRVPQNVREKDALVYLKAILVLERSPALLRKRLCGWYQPRQQRCGVTNELLDADESAVIVGELAIDSLDVGGQEPLARLSLRLKNNAARRRLRFVAR